MKSTFISQKLKTKNSGGSFGTPAAGAVSVPLIYTRNRVYFGDQLMENPSGTCVPMLRFSQKHFIFSVGRKQLRLFP